MPVNFTLPSDLFEHFQALHSESNYEIIRFYETHENAIQYIDIYQQFTILCYYSNSLFAIGEYKKYLSFARIVLEMSIIERIRYLDNVDVYLHSLKQKTIAHLELHEVDLAILTAKQLLALKPSEKPYRILLRKTLMRKRPQWVLKVFGASLWAAIIWTSIELLQLMYLEAFLPQSVSSINLLQFLVLISGVICFFTAWRGHQRHVEKIIKGILQVKS